MKLLGLLTGNWPIVAIVVAFLALSGAAWGLKAHGDRLAAELRAERAERAADREVAQALVAHKEREIAALEERDRKAAAAATERDDALREEYGRTARSLGARLGLCLTAQAAAGAGAVPGAGAAAGSADDPPDLAADLQRARSLAGQAVEACSAEAARLTGLQQWVTATR